MCIRDRTGVGLSLLQCCVLHSVCSSSVLALIGFAVARNKDSCPSHPRVLESDRTPVFLLLLLLLPLLLLLASAVGASVAAAAAALFVGPALCFLFYSNSSAKAIWLWMLYRTVREVTCTKMRKNTYVVLASLAE